MPEITVSMAAGRTDEQKAGMMRDITQALVKNLGVDADAVVIQIKDLIEGAKAAAAIASNQEWRETRPAQFSCGEGEIVAKVREVLARHDVKWG